jgi:hypothetical protein
MGYYLNREAFRVVERNDRGNVTYRKRYRRGDEVDVSHIDETHVENLVNSGALVESEDDVQETPEATAQSQGAAAQASVAGDLGSTATGAPEEPVEVPEDQMGDVEESDDEAQASGDADPDHPNVGGSSSPEQVEEVDEFSAMDRGELQAAAKRANVSTSGSTDTLRARLRENKNA